MSKSQQLPNEVLLQVFQLEADRLADGLHALESGGDEDAASYATRASRNRLQEYYDWLYLTRSLNRNFRKAMERRAFRRIDLVFDSARGAYGHGDQDDEEKGQGGPANYVPFQHDWKEYLDVLGHHTKQIKELYLHEEPFYGGLSNSSVRDWENQVRLLVKQCWSLQRLVLLKCDGDSWPGVRRAASRFVSALRLHSSNDSESLIAATLPSYGHLRNLNLQNLVFGNVPKLDNLHLQSLRLSGCRGSIDFLENVLPACRTSLEHLQATPLYADLAMDYELDWLLKPLSDPSQPYSALQTLSIAGESFFEQNPPAQGRLDNILRTCPNLRSFKVPPVLVSLRYLVDQGSALVTSRITELVCATEDCLDLRLLRRNLRQKHLSRLSVFRLCPRGVKAQSSSKEWDRYQRRLERLRYTLGKTASQLQDADGHVRDWWASDYLRTRIQHDADFLEDISDEGGE